MNATLLQYTIYSVWSKMSHTVAKWMPAVENSRQTRQLSYVTIWIWVSCGF